MPRRRRKSGLFEDLFDIAATLPWWAGLLLALISFIGFHSVAQIEIAPPSQPAELGHNISRQLFKTFSSILQYVFPAILCLGAAASFFSRLKRRKLFDRVQHKQTALTQLSWKEFELLVGEAFRQRGYAVEETGDGADGGIDLVLTKNGERTLAQCKHWKVENPNKKLRPPAQPAMPLWLSAPQREAIALVPNSGVAHDFRNAGGRFRSPKQHH